MVSYPNNFVLQYVPIDYSTRIKVKETSHTRMIKSKTLAYTCDDFVVLAILNDRFKTRASSLAVFFGVSLLLLTRGVSSF